MLIGEVYEDGAGDKWYVIEDPSGNGDYLCICVWHNTNCHTVVTPGPNITKDLTLIQNADGTPVCKLKVGDIWLFKGGPMGILGTRDGTEVIYGAPGSNRRRVTSDLTQFTEKIWPRDDVEVGKYVICN